MAELLKKWPLELSSGPFGLFWPLDNTKARTQWSWELALRVSGPRETPSREGMRLRSEQQLHLSRVVTPAAGQRLPQEFSS